MGHRQRQCQPNEAHWGVARGVGGGGGRGCLFSLRVAPDPPKFGVTLHSFFSFSFSLPPRGMEEDAATRRARLRRLREEAGGGGADDVPATATTAPAAAAATPPSAAAAPVLKFRNYAPADKGLPADLAPATVPPPPSAPVVDNPLAAAGADTDALLAAVAPKDPTADLKRDIGPKLAKLERRTQRAMVEMMREAEAEGREP